MFLVGSDRVNAELLEPPPDTAEMFNPERELHVLMDRARGDTFRAIAAKAGLVVSHVFHICKRHEAWLEAAKKRLQQNILEHVDSPTMARIADASNPESKTGAQSYRVLMEVAGLVGNTRIHIGDNVQNVLTVLLPSGLRVDCDAESDAREALGLVREVG